jgi:hypothetical protein
MRYPDSLPCPLRNGFRRRRDALTIRTRMQSGYIIQRRLEPWTFRQLTLQWEMRMPEYHEFFDWANRYGFTWHEIDIQGVTKTIRYISPIRGVYTDYGRVLVSVDAEEQAVEDAELWEGAAPEIYAPPVNDPDAPVDGGVVPDIDLDVAFEPYDLTLDVVPKQLIFRASPRPAAIGTIYVYGSDAITIRPFDGSSNLASTEEDFVRFHTDPDRSDGMLKLTAGEDYQLRISGTVGDVVTVWGTSLWL